MLLSIGLMVKNEEKYLDQCLRGLKPILDNIDSELIIVDTGSKDQTLEIARRHTSNVYEHKWTGNFAEMRNIVLSHTKGEWFFFVDGDEVLTDASGIIDFFKSGKHRKYNSGSIPMKNLVSQTDEEAYSVFRAFRLFRNDKDFHFKGMVHEQPITKGPIANIPGEVIHYGYFNDDPELMEYKFKRNVELLEKQLGKEPKNVYVLYQLAQSYAMYSDNKKAYEYSLQAYAIAQKGDLSQYKYLLGQIANLHNHHKKYFETEAVCEIGIKLERNNLDLYYFLAGAQLKLSKFEEAIKSYERYLKLLDKFEKGTLEQHLTTEFRTVHNRDKVCGILCSLYNETEQYDKAISYGKKLEKEANLKTYMSNMVDAYLKLEQLDGLKAYLKSKKDNQEIYALVEKTIEGFRLKMEKEQKSALSGAFADEESPYGLLNLVRVDDETNKKGLGSSILSKIASFNLGALPTYYADFLYTFLRYDKSIAQLLAQVKNERISGYVVYLNSTYEEFSSALITNLKDEKQWSAEVINPKEAVRIRTGLLYGLLLENTLEDDEYLAIFRQYIELGTQYIEVSYHEDLLNDLAVTWLRNGADAFLMFLRGAQKREKHSVDYVRLLRLALAQDESMNRGIELLIQEVEEQLGTSQNKELEELKESIQGEIKKALNQGELETTVALINQYEDAVGLDAPLCGAKGIVYMIEGQLSQAETVFLEGLRFNPDDADLLYNLGYLAEEQGRNREAFDYYSKALENVQDEEFGVELNESIQRVKPL